LVFNYPIANLPNYKGTHPCPPMYTQFHPGSPNPTQASAEGRKNLMALRFTEAITSRGSQPGFELCLADSYLLIFKDLILSCP
jgi:hypothetical protein